MDKCEHNPLIFRDKPSDIYKLLNKTLEGRIRMRLSDKDYVSDSLSQADKLYELAVSKLKHNGVYDAAIEQFGVPPIVPQFVFETEELAMDSPIVNKMYGVPDFRRFNTDSINYLSLYPRDRHGNFMKFVAQFNMPQVYWDILTLSGAYVDEKYNRICSPLGDLNKDADNMTYVFISNEFNSEQFNAYVLLLSDGEDNDIPWNIYVDKVKKIVPDSIDLSIPLKSPIITMDYDFGDENSFVDLIEEKDIPDEEFYGYIGYDKGDCVSIGGKPRVNSISHRPWNIMGVLPSRMVPFFNYLDESSGCSVHQIYIGSDWFGRCDYRWGYDEIS